MMKGNVVYYDGRIEIRRMTLKRRGARGYRVMVYEVAEQDTLGNALGTLIRDLAKPHDQPVAMPLPSEEPDPDQPPI